MNKRMSELEENKNQDYVDQDWGFFIEIDSYPSTKRERKIF